MALLEEARARPAFVALVEREMWSEYVAIANAALSGMELHNGPEDPFLICDSKHGILNRVVHTRQVSEDELRKAIKAVHSRFAGRPFQWWHFSGAGNLSLDILTSERLRQCSDMLLMWADLDKWTQCAVPLKAPAGLTIRGMAPHELLTFMSIVYSANYGPEPRSGQSSEQKIEEARVYAYLMSGSNSNDWQHYVGVVDGQLIASVSIRNGAGWGNGTDYALHHLAVLQSFQRRGYGKTLLHHALRSAHSMGGKRMVLEASPAGARLYESEGFRTEAQLSVFGPVL